MDLIKVYTRHVLNNYVLLLHPPSVARYQDLIHHGRQHERWIEWELLGLKIGWKKKTKKKKRKKKSHHLRFSVE